MLTGPQTGEIKSPDDLAADDFRRRFPRFQGEAFYHNLDLVKEIEVLAKRKGVTPAQVGLGWIRTLSGKNGLPVLIPIPGASSDGRVRENSANITLTDGEMAEIETILKEFTPKGGRYSAHAQAHLNG
jgi:pyridoxine 4-dehydrogenase